MCLTGIKDLDLYILSSLDDSDIIKISKTCKYAYRICKDQLFWKKKLVKRFKKYTVFPKSKSYKKLYFSLNSFYKTYKRCLTYQFDELLIHGAFLDNFDIINFAIANGAEHWLSAMCEAAKGGHLETVKYFVHNGTSFWGAGLLNAAIGQNREVIEYFIEKGANNWDGGMLGAIQAGNLELVKFFIDKGAEDWDLGLYHSFLADNKNMMNFFEDLGGELPEGICSYERSERARQYGYY